MFIATTELSRQEFKLYVTVTVGYFAGKKYWQEVSG